MAAVASAASIPGGMRALTSEQELRLRSHEELVGLVRRLESDKLTLMSEHSAVMREVNKRLQMHLVEIRALREANEKAENDARALKAASDRAAADARDAGEQSAVETKELRELCCFLDDERQRLRHLAHEWQRYSQQIAASAFGYNLDDLSIRINDLEQRQKAVVDENSHLRELCLYLDDERIAAAATRDTHAAAVESAVAGIGSLCRGLGDGASSLTIGTSTAGKVGSLAQPTDDYIKALEKKVQTLEQEKSDYQKILEVRDQLERAGSRIGAVDSTNAPSRNVNQPDESAHATAEELGYTEKAIVRELCNVIWRKLGERGGAASLVSATNSVESRPGPQGSSPVGNRVGPQGSSLVDSTPAPQNVQPAVSRVNTHAPDPHAVTTYATGASIATDTGSASGTDLGAAYARNKAGAPALRNVAVFATNAAASHVPNETSLVSVANSVHVPYQTGSVGVSHGAVGTTGPHGAHASASMSHGAMNPVPYASLAHTAHEHVSNNSYVSKAATTYGSVRSTEAQGRSTNVDSYTSFVVTGNVVSNGERAITAAQGRNGNADRYGSTDLFSNQGAGQASQGWSSNYERHPGLVAKSTSGSLSSDDAIQNASQNNYSNPVNQSYASLAASYHNAHMPKTDISSRSSSISSTGSWPAATTATVPHGGGGVGGSSSAGYKNASNVAVSGGYPPGNTVSTNRAPTVVAPDWQQQQQQLQHRPSVTAYYQQPVSTGAAASLPIVPTNTRFQSSAVTSERYGTQKPASVLTHRT